jgi:hypothetical protein
MLGLAAHEVGDLREHVGDWRLKAVVDQDQFADHLGLPGGASDGVTVTVSWCCGGDALVVRSQDATWPAGRHLQGVYYHFLVKVVILPRWGYRFRGLEPAYRLR